MLALLGLVAKTSLLLGAALAVAPKLCRSVAARHQWWRGVLAAALFLPFLSWVLPKIDVLLPTAVSRVASTTATQSAMTPSRVDHSDVSTSTTSDGSGAMTVSLPEPGHGVATTVADWSSSDVVTLVWSAGTMVGVVMLGISLFRVRRLARRADVLLDPAWRAAVERIGRQVGVRPLPHLLMTAEAASPTAGGLFAPAIYLPSGARYWDAEVRDVVLTHELSHLAARDPLTHAIARLSVALHWFNPLAWIVANRGAAAREDACDEAVLALGTPPSSYARILLELADSACPSPLTAAALPMVQRSHLERRLMTILDSRRRHPARPSRWLTPGLVALTLAVAAVRPIARVVDFGNTTVPTTEQRAGVAENPARTSVAPAIAAAQTDVSPDSACWWNGAANRSFSGTISSTNRTGRVEIREQIGRHGSDRIIQQSFGTLRVCMLAEDAAQDDALPSQLLGRAGRVVIESRRGDSVQRLEVAAGRTRWKVNGRDRNVDRTAEAWRTAMLAVLDTTWQISNVRGQVSSLRGQISSVRGQESSLRGRISSLYGDVSSMRGRISSIRGGESSLNGEISSIQGHLSSLRGQISSEEGAVSSLTARRYGADDAERGRISASVAEHESAIQRIEKEVRDYDASARIAAVRKELDGAAADAKVAEIEKQIKDFDLNAKVGAIEKQIRDLDVDGKVAAIEQQIRALDADQRVAALESRLDEAVKQLGSALSAIR